MAGIGGGAALQVRTPRLRVPPPAPPPVPGPFVRVLGIDAPQGWSVVDVNAARRGVYIASGELGDADPCGELEALLEAHGPALVAFEVVAELEQNGEIRGTVYPRAGFGPSMATRLYLAGRRVGQLEERVRARGLRVVTALEREVRDYWIHPRPEKGRADAAVEAALRFLVPSWPGPRKTTTHQRDGGLLAVYAGATAGGLGP